MLSSSTGLPMAQGNESWSGTSTEQLASTSNGSNNRDVAADTTYPVLDDFISEAEYMKRKLVKYEDPRLVAQLNAGITGYVKVSVEVEYETNVELGIVTAETRDKILKKYQSKDCDGNLKFWQSKWNCTLRYCEPSREGLGVFRHYGCHCDHVFCWDCIQMLQKVETEADIYRKRELKVRTRCIAACGPKKDTPAEDGRRFNLWVLRFAPYPKELLNMMEMKKKAMERWMKELRYLTIQRKRQSNLLGSKENLTPEQLEKYLANEDKMQVSFEKFELRQEVKMVKDDTEMHRAYNKGVRLHNKRVLEDRRAAQELARLESDDDSAIIQTEEGLIGVRLTPTMILEQSIGSDRVLRLFSCHWTWCPVRFNKREERDKHFKLVHGAKFKCIAPHCEFKTDSRSKFKLHYHHCDDPKTNNRCPSIKDPEMRRLVKLTCKLCGLSFPKSSNLYRHERHPTACKGKPSQQAEQKPAATKKRCNTTMVPSGRFAGDPKIHQRCKVMVKKLSLT